MPHPLVTSHKHWVFDMDGTLTLAVHDFDAIRAELGLPEGRPILEALDDLPQAKAAVLHKQLDAIELEIAKDSKPAEGAEELLITLLGQGADIGILTRNNKVNIEVTLQAAGLLHLFSPQNLLSRDCAAPKPAPAGILKLLDQWDAKVEKAVMVGDHMHDLKAGRAAGATTVYVDPSEQYEFALAADVCVGQLTNLF